jgi:hypothetical protein
VPPRKVIIIRHAEKPAEGVADGVDMAGNPDPHSLTPAGWQRAGALVRFFAPRTGQGVLPVSTPDAIFAAGVGPGRPSKRAIQTAWPLASFLARERAVPFVASHLKDDLDALAEDVLARSGCVLLVWEHKMMAALVHRLTSGAHRLAPWDSECFDGIWLLDRSGSGWAFSQASQHLLPADRADMGAPLAAAGP